MSLYIRFSPNFRRQIKITWFLQEYQPKNRKLPAKPTRLSWKYSPRIFFLLRTDKWKEGVEFLSSLIYLMLYKCEYSICSSALFRNFTNPETKRHSFPRSKSNTRVYTHSSLCSRMQSHENYDSTIKNG